MVMARIRTASLYSYCNNFRGMPYLQSSLVLFFNNFFASSSHSQGSIIRNTQTKTMRHPPNVSNLQDALSLFNSMLRMRPPPSIVRFTQILGQIVKLKHYSAAINLYKQMGPSGLISEAEKFLREMQDKGCSPNDCTYNTIIRGFLNNNETYRAVELVQEMVNRGFSADASTMELVVDLLSKDKVDPALLALIEKKRAPAWEDVLSRNFLGSVDGKVGNILADELAVIG